MKVFIRRKARCKSIHVTYLFVVHHDLLVPELLHGGPLVRAVSVEAEQVPVVGLGGQHVAGEVVPEGLGVGRELVAALVGHLVGVPPAPLIVLLVLVTNLGNLEPRRLGFLGDARQQLLLDSFVLLLGRHGVVTRETVLEDRSRATVPASAAHMRVPGAGCGPVCWPH